MAEAVKVVVVPKAEAVKAVVVLKVGAVKVEVRLAAAVAKAKAMAEAGLAALVIRLVVVVAMHRQVAAVRSNTCLSHPPLFFRAAWAAMTTMRDGFGRLFCPWQFHVSRRKVALGLGRGFTTVPVSSLTLHWRGTGRMRSLRGLWFFELSGLRPSFVVGQPLNLNVRRMRTYTIAPASPISLKAVASVYVGAFGTIWLFVEPLGLFGLVPPVGGVAGLVSYLLMLGAAMFVLLAFLRGYQWYKTHDLPFVSFKVMSSSDGATYALRVSENMQVGDFLHDFLRLLSRGPGREKVKMFSHRYTPILQVRRGDQFVDVDSNVTIGGAGLKDSDICQVRGKLSEVFNRVMFSRAPIRDEPADP